MTKLPPILVVDDNYIIVELIQDLCQHLGYMTEAVESGEAAIERAREAEYFMIMMDLRLPGICGVEAAIAIRNLPPPFSTVPIIALSGMFPVPGIIKWDAARFDDTLFKPFSVVELDAAIQRVIARQSIAPH